MGSKWVMPVRHTKAEGGGDPAPPYTISSQLADRADAETSVSSNEFFVGTPSRKKERIQVEHVRCAHAPSRCDDGVEHSKDGRPCSSNSGGTKGAPYRTFLHHPWLDCQPCQPHPTNSRHKLLDYRLIRHPERVFEACQPC
eukprot:365800-Chlamydomonas_euryale.AAC.35